MDSHDLARAEDLKLLANKSFNCHKYNLAIQLYTEAIKLNTGNAIYWGNRALAHTKLEDYVNAIRDASKAIKLNQKYTKGFYRRGEAYLATKKFKEALKDFQQEKKFWPRCADDSKKLRECEKAMGTVRLDGLITLPELKKALSY